jgi:hypothetical protein
MPIHRPSRCQIRQEINNINVANRTASFGRLSKTKEPVLPERVVMDALSVQVAPFPIDRFQSPSRPVLPGHYSFDAAKIVDFVFGESHSPTLPSPSFRQALLFENVIVVEQSPPDLQSFTHLVTHATGVAVGAYVGASVASGPLLFITVPAGMIVMGAASGIGKALEAGLREAILKWLRRWNGKTSPRTPPPPRTPPRPMVR